MLSRFFEFGTTGVHPVWFAAQLAPKGYAGFVLANGSIAGLPTLIAPPEQPLTRLAGGGSVCATSASHRARSR